MTQEITNYWIEETNFGFALKGNREISGFTTIGYFDTKIQAEAEMNKLISKSKKFENVEINQIVSFEENGMIKSGVVDMVCDKMFTLRVISTWDKNGVLVTYNRYLNFFKSGKKTNRYHTNGNALQIVGNVNQTL
jgi:hypothetical protein